MIDRELAEPSTVDRSSVVQIFTQMRDLLVDCASSLERIRDREPSESEPEPNSSQREYKVLTQKDRWFSGKFDPSRLEEALNSYAEQGWSVKGVTTASIPGFGGNRDELIVVLER